MPWGLSPPLSLYNFDIILLMIKIPNHKPYIFLMVIIRCNDTCQTSPLGVIPTAIIIQFKYELVNGRDPHPYPLPSLYNLNIIF